MNFANDLKSCGFLLLRGEPVDSFLLMKHANRWDLPKGHVDPGETDLECALRELEEETGITMDDFEIVPDFEFRHQYQVNNRRSGYEPATKTLLIYLGRMTSEVSVVPTEHLSYQWFDWQPPHRIQEQTIDPLLTQVESFLGR